MKEFLFNTFKKKKYCMAIFTMLHANWLALALPVS